MYEKMMATKMEPIDLGATTMTSLPTHHHHPQHHHNIQMISHAHAHHVPATMQPLSQLGMQHHHHSANSSPNPQQMGSVAQDENSPISMISSQVIEKKFTSALLRTYPKGTLFISFTKVGKKCLYSVQLAMRFNKLIKYVRKI